MSSPAPHLRFGPLAALGNAFYLGTSWTWVIGMLFPALLLRDYGLWGFVAFAVPNVVGAAAMGFVLTPERARGILERHKTACAWFSVATLAFHLFVVAWLLPALLGPWSVALVVLTVGACLAAQKIAGTKGVWIASALVWFLSMAMFWQGAHTDGAWTGSTWEMGQLGKDGLLAFVPASVLGFALCPYLDLTFLKARAETEKNTGRAAFALGFGVVFCAMIFFTVCYGGQLWDFFNGESKAQLNGDWRWILMTHLPVQIGLTLAWHGMELNKAKSALPQLHIVPGFLSAAKEAKGTNSIPASDAILPWSLILGFILGCESLYLSFLLLYGTVLPAYVLLKMIPTRRPVSDRLRTIVFICASLLSYPLAFGAFVLHHHWLILPCAFVLTLAFLAVQLGPKAQIQETAA